MLRLLRRCKRQQPWTRNGSFDRICSIWHRTPRLSHSRYCHLPACVFIRNPEIASPRRHHVWLHRSHDASSGEAVPETLYKPTQQTNATLQVLSRKLGRDPNDIIKLDANENPYGASPEVLDALASMPFPHIYPDPECRALREQLAIQNDTPAENILVRPQVPLRLTDIPAPVNVCATAPHSSRTFTATTTAHPLSHREHYTLPNLWPSTCGRVDIPLTPASPPTIQSRHDLNASATSTLQQPLSAPGSPPPIPQPPHH